MAVQLPALKPIENQWFAQQLRRAKSAYDIGSAQNTYDRGLASKQAGWNRADLTQAYKRNREGFTTPYLQRGMQNSGGYGRNLYRFKDDYLKQQDRMRYGDMQRNIGFDMAEKNLQSVRDMTFSDLEDQKREYRRTIATVLDGMWNRG